MRRTTAAVLAAAAGLAAGCSAPASPGSPAATTASAAPATALRQPVAAVPGTGSNTYIAGPFTVTLLATQRIPGPGCPAAGTGPSATTGIAVKVKNTSRSFYGYASPSVVFVKGHSLRGPVAATLQGGTPEYGCVGGTDPLHPGQSQTVWIVPSLPRTYYTWQLASVTYYSSASTQANLGTTVQFKW